jgi:Domain of unknown function (DUF309)
VSPRKGVELFNAGLYWEAHEAWEQAWISDRHGPDRGFYKGLVQVAAGCLHYGRGNGRGAISKWCTGAASFQTRHAPGEAVSACRSGTTAGHGNKAEDSRSA